MKYRVRCETVMNFLPGSTELNHDRVPTVRVFEWTDLESAWHLGSKIMNLLNGQWQVCVENEKGDRSELLSQ